MRYLPKIIIIVGPTASGKTALSLELAKKFNGEIVNADSRQVYRKMDIGTAKAPKDIGQSEYIVQGILHHLIDVVDPDEEFTLAHYKKMAFKVIDNIFRQGKLPIIVGGTGLYVWSIVDNLDIPAVAPNSKLRQALDDKSLDELVIMLKNSDPITAEKIDLKNPRRVKRALEVIMTSNESLVLKQKKLPSRYDSCQIGINVPRDELNMRINERVDRQINDGLIEEVKSLAKNFDWSLPSMSAIGYKEIGYFLRGEMQLDEAVELIKRNTRRYAKRQMTWFRRDKRICWTTGVTEAKDLIEKFIK